VHPNPNSPQFKVNEPQPSKKRLGVHGTEQNSSQPDARAINLLAKKGFGLYLLDLPVALPGFRHFITPWLITEDKPEGIRNILIDPGPACTVPKLIKLLERLEIEKLDYILLTHIHIDHAGGVGDLLKTFPRANVLVHSRGLTHLLNPDRLWKASLKTLGQVARTYGEILPVPKGNLLSEDTKMHGLEVIETPGHAPHHLAFVYNHSSQHILFSGEAAGICLNHEDSKLLYLRPATPPKFFFDITMHSLQKLMVQNCTVICYGHYGYSKNPDKMLALHRDQLILWKEVISESLNSHNSADKITDTLLSRLMLCDGLLTNFDQLEDDIRTRERFFLENSIRGFIDYIENLNT